MRRFSTLPLRTFLLLAAFSVAMLPAFATADEGAQAFREQVLSFMDKNCLVCHNAQRKAGKVDLTHLKQENSITEHRDDWDTLLLMIETGAMPPPEAPPEVIPPTGLPKPEVQEVEKTAKLIRNEFDRVAKSIRPAAGRVTARRLNRAEYNNTVQDLLGVKQWPANSFPQDGSNHGFDNLGEALNISPLLMEKYLAAAEGVAREAVYGPAKLEPSLKKLEQLERNHPDITAVPAVYDLTGLNMDRSMHKMHHFPVDGVYKFVVVSRGFRPLGCKPLECGLWLDGELVAEVKVEPEENGPSLLGGRQDLFGKPKEVQLTVSAGDHWVAASVLRMYEGLPMEYGGKNPANPSAPPSPAMPEAIPEPMAEGAPMAEAAGRGRRGGGARRGGGGGRRGGTRLTPIDTQIGIDYVDVVGPLSQPAGPSLASLQKVYGGTGDPKSLTPERVTEIIRKLAPRAFRRPVRDQELNRYLQLASLVREQGDSAAESLVVAIQALLVSPDFLFRIERTPEGLPTGSEYRLSQHELASRLSYFLWSSMPDDELLACANAGSLSDPKVLEAQVQRMIASAKSAEFVKNFGGQWLQVRALESVTPDFEAFGAFDEYLRLSMREETEHFLAHVLRENGSLLDLIDADYTFLNNRLAEFYGIPGIEGTNFRKVQLPADGPRGGVVTQASVLTVSSYATRTSPVLRGKWILENLLNQAPPPPPPNVPALEAASKNNPNASMREQLALHRTNATCAACHVRMDPLGMGLENFDAIGAWRSKDGKSDVDASGDLPDGRKFNGPDGLKQVLLQDRDAFTACVAEKLMIYALGRGLQPFDHQTVQTVADKAAASEYRFSSLVLEIVNSLPFQYQLAQSPSEG